MEIKKILNNNVIITNDQSGNEVVAMGCGIAFGRKVGDNILDDKVDKIYTLSNHEMLEKFKTLVADLSLDYLNVTDSIIEKAEEVLECKLNESIYISLTDHIHMAIQRIREDVVVRNMMLWEIRRFYPKEFKISEWAVQLLNEKFQVEMPEDEAGFIAMHLIDAQMNSEQPLSDKIMKLIGDVANIVRYTCNIEFDKDSLQYYRFVTHLKFFAKRVLVKQKGTNDIDEEMEAMVQKKYALAHKCTDKIAAFIEKNYNYKVNKDEKFYLMIHISKVIRQN